MEEYPVLFRLFGINVTYYAAFVAGGCLLGLICFLISGRKIKPAALALTALLSIGFGLLGARLFYAAARYDIFSEFGWGNFFRAAEPEMGRWDVIGGAALWGAAGGVALAALIAGKLTGMKAGLLLDAFAPGAALAIAISRFGEYYLGEGIGPELAEESPFRFFPFAVVNSWEEWNWAIFMLEGIAAVAIFILLITCFRKLDGGYRARMFVILYSSCQVILEALRRDNFLRWMFVRVSQVTAVAVLLVMVIFAILRWNNKPREARMPKSRLVWLTVLFFVITGICVALEFAVDKAAWLPLWLAYLLETVCSIGYGIVTSKIVMKN